MRKQVVFSVAALCALLSVIISFSGGQTLAQSSTRTPTLTRTPSPTRTLTPTRTALPSRTPTFTVTPTIPATRGGERGVIGIGVQDAPDGGALIVSLAPNAPGIRAGLRVGDVITAVNQRAVANADDLVALLAERRAGEQITLNIRRDGQAQVIRLTLIRPTATPRNISPTPMPAQPTSTLPPRVTPTPVMVRVRLAFPRYGFEAETLPDGLRVSRVELSSPTATMLRIGDLITQVENIRYAPGNISRIVTLLNTPSISTVTLTVQRSGRTFSVSLLAVGAAGTPTARFTQPPDIPRVRYTFSRYGFQAETLPEGLRVIRIDLPANQTDLRVGDLIIQVDTILYAPNTLSSIVRLLNSPAREILGVRLLRDGNMLTVTLRAVGSVILPTATPLLAQPTRPAATHAFTPIPGMRVQLGVLYEVITPQVARARGLRVTDGALILEVYENSAAAVAGLRVGDIILAVNGDVVDAKRTLPLRLLPYAPGDTVTLTVLRGNQRLNVQVTFAQRGVAMH
ncbi:MAG: PDZ domain-containing protein [Chloroflexi bacterium CFX4]|nr:PDZ domain-containing protein [Chloroflexi bacterium CFX4]MDL1922816.1 PDZ domain-containing protein [Chloroflexi bacterium CFX3]